MKAVPALLLCAIVSSNAVHADTLLVDRVAHSKSAAIPARGSTMAQVESRYGAPESRIEAVGQPPISRWIYPAFTVYFEHDHVVHAVINKASSSEKGPKPAR